jgi:hypothetical protein
MADQQNVSQELAQVELELGAEQKVSQELAQVELEFVGKQQISQIIGQIEYTAFMAYDAIQSQIVDAVWVHNLITQNATQLQIAGNIVFAGTPAGPGGLWFCHG